LKYLSFLDIASLDKFLTIRLLVLTLLELFFWPNSTPFFLCYYPVYFAIGVQNFIFNNFKIIA
jgi:uncharacterized membrane protein YoaK (UPF0700 family)